MRRSTTWCGLWRGGGALLVALALALRLATPAGWMLTQGQGGPQLVICTGHAIAPGRPESPSNRTDKTQQHACVFAGAHAAPQPPLIACELERQAVAFPASVGAAVVDQRPGRGLAAPPPPSQGPPITS